MNRDKLLKIMINTFASCFNEEHPISIANIAQLEKDTYYSVRKSMKQLEAEQLVKKETYYYPRRL